MRNVLHKASKLQLSRGVASAQGPSRSGAVLPKAGEAVTIGFSECGQDRLQFGWPAIRSKLRINNIIEL